MSDNDPWNRYAIVPAAVLQMSELSIGPRLTYALLCGYADKPGYTWVTHGTLAENLGVSPRTVDNHLNQLEPHGLVERLLPPSRFRFRVIRSPGLLDSTRVANRLKAMDRKARFGEHGRRGAAVRHRHSVKQE